MMRLKKIWQIFSAFSISVTISSMAADLDKVIAHRGASFDAPENSASAIALAIEQGAKVIEFDIRQTVDGALFLFHDNELKRLCGCEGTFEKLTASEAGNLDVGSWFTKGKFADEKPQRLGEAIEQCLAGGAIPLIEHKTGSPEAYAKVLSDLDVVNRVIVQSFNWNFIKAIREILPEVKTGALGSKKLSARKKALLELKPNWVGWSDRDIEEADLRWLKENEFLIAIWTVNDPGRAQYLVDNGVDKVITDRPGYLGKNIKSE